MGPARFLCATLLQLVISVIFKHFAHQTLPIVMVAFLEDKSAFVSDLFLCFEKWCQSTFIRE